MRLAKSVAVDSVAGASGKSTKIVTTVTRPMGRTKLAQFVGPSDRCTPVFGNAHGPAMSATAGGGATRSTAAVRKPMASRTAASSASLCLMWTPRA
jgi:hypothetical protein